MYVLKTAWKKWVSFGKVIGNFQAQVIFSIFYLLVFSVLGIILSFFSDPLNIKKKKSSKKRSNFYLWQYKSDTLKEAQKQF